jgi:TonB family protein
LFLGLSVVGHIILLGLLSTGVVSTCDTRIPLAKPQPARRPLEITTIGPQALSASGRSFLEAQKKLEEKRKEEARKPEEDPDVRGQVVDMAAPAVEIRPDDARFLSEHDIKVLKETKGPTGREEAGAARPSVQQPPQRPTAVAPKPSPPSQQGASSGPAAMAMRESTPGKQTPGAVDGMEKKGEGGTIAPRGDGAQEKVDGPQASQGNKTPGGEKPGEKGSGVSPQPTLAELRPSEEMIARSVGAGSSDYLKDVDEGAEGLVNTARWKYATFFNRVKGQVRDNWHPDHAYALRDPTGQIYGHKNRYTVLKVSLAPDGKLHDLVIEKPCGVEFLDDEALTAFRAAEPFPNPPPGLVDKDSNLITFRFGFYFEIQGPPTFKILRYN